MDTKTSSMCNIEKQINNFDKKYSACRNCNRARGLKQNIENKDKISNQPKIYYEKKEIKYYYRKRTIDEYSLEI